MAATVVVPLRGVMVMVLSMKKGGGDDDGDDVHDDDVDEAMLCSQERHVPGGRGDEVL
jgi:hypothetical protein